jgi:hypothetical protein
MAKSHGKDSVFWIDNVGGTPVDLSVYCDSIDVPFTTDTAESSTMGTSSKVYLVGLDDGTISIGGPFDNTATVGPDAVLGGIKAAHGELTAGGSLTWIYGPEGQGDGDIEYTGECFQTGYNVKSDLSGVVKFTSTFQITGDVERTAFSA